MRKVRRIAQNALLIAVIKESELWILASSLIVVMLGIMEVRKYGTND